MLRSASSLPSDVLADQSMCSRLICPTPCCTVQRRLSTGCPPTEPCSRLRLRVAELRTRPSTKAELEERTVAQYPQETTARRTTAGPLDHIHGETPAMEDAVKRQLRQEFCDAMDAGELDRATGTVAGPCTITPARAGRAGEA